MPIDFSPGTRSWTGAQSFQSPALARPVSASRREPDAGAQAQIDAALRARIDAARQAQRNLDAAIKAQQVNQDKAKNKSLLDDVTTKTKVASNLWAEVKADVKGKLQAVQPGGRDALVSGLKASESDPLFGKLVDEAKAEPPNLAIVASGNAGADAAAGRVAAAYATGGDAAAAAQLRVELEDVQTTGQRHALVQAAKPILDQVSEDLGLNSRRAAGDWGKDGHELGGAYSTDGHNANPIDSQAEYDDTLKNVSASLEVAGDPAVAMHVAQKLLQVMPGGRSGNSGSNLLGLLGSTLPPVSAEHRPLLTSAVAVALVQPGKSAPAGGELSIDLTQRLRAAKTLDPGLLPTATVADWEDSRGVRHDGTVWHEVSQNPDLFLSDRQRTEIEASTRGWPAAEVGKEKTAQAVRNLRAQYPGENLDKVNEGDRFAFADPAAAAAPALPEEVRAAVNGAIAAHAGDSRYAQDIGGLVLRADFRQMGVPEQVAAVNAYDRTVSQASRGGAPISGEQEVKLQNLLVSKGYHSVNDRVKDRVLGMFAEYAGKSPDKLDALQRLVNEPHFGAIDNESEEFQILEGYQNDPAFEAQVNRLVARTDLNAGDRSSALDLMGRVKFNRQLYDKADAADRDKIMGSVYEAVTSPQFRGFSETQRNATVNYLVKYGDEEYALENGGVNKALEKAATLAAPKPLESPVGATAPAGTGNSTGMFTLAPTQAATAQPAATDTGATAEATRPAGSTGLVTPTAPGPWRVPMRAPTDDVRSDVARVAASASDFAGSDATINDPLRRVAKEDPIAFAHLTLAEEHQKDPVYLDALKQALPQQRREYTAQAVKDLMARDKVGEALQVLKTGLDATANPAERAELFRAAGQPMFSAEEFDKRILAIADDKHNVFDAAKDLGELFESIGVDAPPEVANQVLDALQRHLASTGEDPVARALVVDVSLKGEAFSGLSVLVDAADSLGRDRAGEFAGLLYKQIESAAKDRAGNPGLSLALRNSTGGVFDGMKDAVGGHGSVRLSVAFHNELSAASGPDSSEWAGRAKDNTRTAIRQGAEALKRDTAGAVSDWQDKNKTALRFVQDFGSTDPAKVAQAILDDRKADPAAAKGVDAAQAQSDTQGLKLDRLVRGLVDIDIDFDHTSDPGERALGKTIRGLDEDQAAMSTLQNNVLLQQDVATKLNFGEFDGNENPLNPAAIVGAQQDHIDKLIRDYHLPDSVAGDLRSRTDAWKKDVRAEVDKGDKASDPRLTSLIDDYQKDIGALLKGRVPDNGTALVQPTEPMVKEVRTDLQSVGTVTSTLRLTKNFYTVTGEAVLNSYAMVAYKRGLSDPSAWNPNGKVVGNAARLLNADKTLVDDTVKYLKEFKAKAEGLADPKTGLISAADQKALADEFKKGMPDYGSGVDTSDVNHPKHMAARFFRLLGAGCFVGSSINNGTNASNEAGRTSSDVFALGFGAGALTDLYRGIRGVSFSDKGKMIDAISRTRIGQFVESKGGPGAVGDLVKTLKDGGVGSLLTVADMMWAYEDYAGEPLWADDKSNPGDWRAGALTTGVVVGDLIDLGAMGLRTQLGRAALTGALGMFGADAAAVGAQAWIPVVGWIGAGVTAAFLGARFAYGVSDAKNQFEFGDKDNQRYVDMTRSLGFTDPQLKELLNNNGGASDLKADDWKRSIPGVALWEDGKSFFKEGGVSPMHVMNALFDHNNVPQQQRLQYLQSLSREELKSLVRNSHSVLDHDMGSDGRIDAADCEKMESWMRANGLWKQPYLGA